MQCVVDVVHTLEFGGIHRANPIWKSTVRLGFFITTHQYVVVGMYQVLFSCLAFYNRCTCAIHHPFSLQKGWVRHKVKMKVLSCLNQGIFVFVPSILEVQRRPKGIVCVLVGQLARLLMEFCVGRMYLGG